MPTSSRSIRSKACRRSAPTSSSCPSSSWPISSSSTCRASTSRGCARTRLEDFVTVCLNSLLSILIVLGLLSYVNAYTQGAAPLFRINLIKLSHVFLAIYGVAVVFTISFLRNQIYYHMNRRYARGLNLQNVLVIGAGELGRTVAGKLVEYKDLGFVVKGFLDDEKPTGEILLVDGGLPVLGRIERRRAGDRGPGHRRSLRGPEPGPLRRDRRDAPGAQPLPGQCPDRARPVPAPDPEGHDSRPGRLPGHLHRRGAAAGRGQDDQAPDGLRRFGPGTRPAVAALS